MKLFTLIRSTWRKQKCPHITCVLFFCGMAALIRTEDSTAEALQHTTSIGFYYSKGEYGEISDTRIRYLPVSHEISRDNWRFKTTVPQLEIRGPANVLVNLGKVGADPAAMASASGVGDVLLNFTYELPVWSESAPFIDISAELKLPTADERRSLGTGKMDAGLQIDLYKMLGRSTVFGALGYKQRGHSVFFEQLKNSWSTSLGFTRPWRDDLQYGAIYDYREAVSAFTGDMHELLPYISWSPTPAWSLMLYFVVGFTDESAERAAGVQLGYRW